MRSRNFEDAQNTWQSPALIGPPVVEFAPYGRVPGGRKRADARQGTIDQDPEFMDFLESLINPVSTKEDTDENGSLEKGQKVTTTPLVQFLKDKKAKKSKDNEAAKAAKQAAKQSDVKAIAKNKDAKSEDSKKAGKEAKKDRLVEKASQEAVKIASRQAAKASAQQASSITGSTEPSKTARGQPRERGSIAAAARILQRDLGLTPGNAHRKAKQDAANAAKAAAVEAGATSPAPTTAGAAKGNGPRGRGANNAVAEMDKDASTAQASPITLLKKPAVDSGASSAITATTSTTPSKATSTPPPPTQHTINKRATPANAVPSTATATRSFIKHANPSQGVTEALLKLAMEAFGPVKFAEMDRKKGFAYVDFAEHDGLKKAMAGSPVKVGQAMVVVLERKDRGASAAASTAGSAGVAAGAGSAAQTGPGSHGHGGRGGHGGFGRGGGGGRNGPRRGGGGRGGAGGPVTGNATAPSAPATKT